MYFLVIFQDSESQELSQESCNSFHSIQLQPQVCTSSGNNISHSNNASSNNSINISYNSSLDNSKVNCKVNTGTNNSTIGNISNTQLQQQLISPRATHVRHVEIEEELLTIEKTKIDIMKQNLDVQRGILECLQSISASTIFNSL